MALVTGYIQNVDACVWGWVESQARSSPATTRLGSIPVAAYYLARDILEGPGLCIEETLHSINMLRYPWRWHDRHLEHICYAVVNGIYTPFSPVVALVNMIASCIKIGRSPLKAAHSKIARLKYEAYCDRISPREGRVLRGMFAEIGCNEEIKLDFAAAEWTKLDKLIWSASSDSDVLALQFDEGVFDAVVEAKYQKYRAVQQRYSPPYDFLDGFKMEIMHANSTSELASIPDPYPPEAASAAAAESP